MNIQKSLFFVLILVASSLPLLGSEGQPSRSMQGITYISSGLLQSGSFSTVEVADQDGDGKYELYLGGAGRNNPRTPGIKSYEYDPSSSSWSAFGSGLPTTGYYGGLGLGDVNGDGNVDIVAPVPTMWYAASTNKVEIFTSNSQSAFSLAHTFSPGESTNEAEIADIDGDSYNDIAFTTYSRVRVYFGSGSATSWTESSPPSAGNEMDGMALGDLNNDDLLDIVSTPYFNSKVVRMYIQGTARNWTEVTFKNTVNEAFGVKIADMNGDGNNDVVYGSRGEGIKVWCGNGGGSSGGTSFSWTDNSTGLPTGGGSWQQVELGDVDSDGDLDIIASSNGQNRTRIYLNNLPGSWTELFSSTPLYLGSGASGYGANFGDWDGDGHLDAAGCSWGGGVDAWNIIWSGTPPPPVRNQRPVPVAPSDIVQMLGTSILLDGRNSTDADSASSGDINGTALVYQWNFTRVPPGSLINDGSLSPNDTAALVTFTPDVPGIYDISLAVFDGEYWSNLTDEDSVRVLTEKPNEPPVAVAGPDQSGYEDALYVLDGRGSYDPDGEITAWEWTCTSHVLAPDDADTSTPSFTPADPGTYTFRLRVMDDNSTWSAPDTVNVTAARVGENVPPVANAGEDQTLILGDEVYLDGSGSSDPDGEIITWEWSCANKDPIFSGLNTSSPHFTAEEEGTYEISLRVMDSNFTWSSPDMVNVIVEVPYHNPPPVADAGEDIHAEVGEIVTLDGSGSFDENGFVAQFNWTCVSHSLTLFERLTSHPSFVPGEAGTYVFTLAVSDNEGAWSQEDEVNVSVTESLPSRYDIRVGPFLYDDGGLVTDGTVEMEPVSGSRMSSSLEDDGRASFSDVLPGTYSISLFMNGSIVLGPVVITVEEDGSVSYGGVQLSVERPDNGGNGPEDPGNNNTGEVEDVVSDGEGVSGAVVVIVVLLILLVLGGAVVLAVFLVKRSGNTRSDDEDEKGERTCPSCGGKMTFSGDFNRYRCIDCGKYG